MKQMITVYRRKGAFLLHPNSQIGERGPWLAQQPGLGLSCDAGDEVLGGLILFLRTHSKQGLPAQDLRAGLPFPLESIAGITSWGTLTKGSPIMVQVRFDVDGITIERNEKDGGGYGPVNGATSVLPFSASPKEIGKLLRLALNENA